MLSWELPPAHTGGTAAHVDGLAHALAAEGHEVVLVSRRTDGTPAITTAGGITVLRADVDLPWVPDHPIGRTASANHALVETALSGVDPDWRPDVVHAHDWTVAWASATLAAAHGAPLVTTFHRTERSRHSGHVPAGVPEEINGVEWWLAARSRQVITITRLLARQVSADFEIDPDLVAPIPGGIDPTWWAATDGHDGVANTTASSGPDSPLVFTWGRVQYEKGFQVLANAMAMVRAEIPGVRCVIAGRGTYLAELQSQIDVAGLSDIIELAGFLGDNALRATLHRADCVVIPSLYEPFGVITLEALAGGAALVAAETGGLAELVVGTGSALTFEPGRAEDLAARILEVLTDHELAAGLRDAARDLVEGSYSWQAIARRTLEVYRRALPS